MSEDARPAIGERELDRPTIRSGPGGQGNRPGRRRLAHCVMRVRHQIHLDALPRALLHALLENLLSLGYLLRHGSFPLDALADDRQEASDIQGLRQVRPGAGVE